MAWIGKFSPTTLLRNIKINITNPNDAIPQGSHIVIFGGSFDPVHNGHIKTALSVQNTFHFDRFIFLPCNIPALKNATIATSQQRLDMLKLAIMNYPEFEVDPREIERSGPSYTMDTLNSFRRELGKKASITLLIGMDAFYSLTKWHCWEDILNQCNLLVMERKTSIHSSMPVKIKTLLTKHEMVNDPHTLVNSEKGLIVRYDAGHYPISSSELRKKMMEGDTIKAFVPENVYDYIKLGGLYSSHQ